MCSPALKEKGPGRIWRGEFIAGTENARLPRACRNSHYNRHWAQASFLGRLAFCDCVLLSRYSTRSAKRVLWGNS